MRRCIVILFLLVLNSCKRPATENPKKTNESEFITSLKLHLRKESENQFSKVLYFKDLDGQGGNDPIIFTDELEANTVYYGRIELLDESRLPTVDVTKEIIDEKNEHQFFYNVFPPDFVEINYQTHDIDDYGVPFGLEPKIKTKSKGNFNLEITLKHQTNSTKPRSGLGDPSIGATDIQVVFENICVK